MTTIQYQQLILSLEECAFLATSRYRHPTVSIKINQIGSMQLQMTFKGYLLSVKTVHSLQHYSNSAERMLFMSQKGSMVTYMKGPKVIFSTAKSINNTEYSKKLQFTVSEINKNYSIQCRAGRTHFFKKAQPHYLESRPYSSYGTSSVTAEKKTSNVGHNTVHSIQSTHIRYSPNFQHTMRHDITANVIKYLSKTMDQSSR